MSVKAHSSIYEITPYVGGDVTPKGMTRRIVLASNENAYGTSPKVKETISSNFQIHSYPSGGATALKQAVAKHFNLNPQQILCGNGSEEILHLIARCFAKHGDEIITPQYGFQVYRIAALSVGAKVIYVPQPNYRLEPALVLKAINDKTKIIYLDNPANPLGTYLNKKELLGLIREIPSHILVVIDSAYADFLDEGEEYTSGLEFVSQFPNLIVTRTFSKFYGLAGLRLGWGYTSPEIIDPLNRIRPPFNVSSLAQIAGIAALEDHQWAVEIRQKTLKTKKAFEQFLTAKQIPYLPSGGNFILIECPSIPGKTAADVHKFLGQKGILVRSVTPYGLPNHLRITIGTDDQMQELHEALGEL